MECMDALQLYAWLPRATVFYSLCDGNERQAGYATNREANLGVNWWKKKSVEKLANLASFCYFYGCPECLGRTFRVN